jgi:two-component system, LytTR family, sensor kinase
VLNNKRRYIYIVFLAILMHLLVKYFAKIGSLGDSILIDSIVYLSLTFILWEGNRIIDQKLDLKISLIPKPAKRIIVQFSISTLYIASITFVCAIAFDYFFYRLSESARIEYIVFSVVIPLVGYAIIFSAEISSRFFLQMQASLLDVEKYKAESLQAHLQNLKNQINPHFLFNNLSVLSSLVYINQDKAVNFIQQLSKVYRYLLDSRSYSLIPLEKELDFINSYTYLLKIRFEEKLIINFDISAEALKLYIPPMALQILIENAIKHNEISSDKKLTLTIASQGDYLLVKNNLQPRSNTEPSSKTGLQNIKDRYSYLTEKEIIINQSKDYFNVLIPLLVENNL